MGVTDTRLCALTDWMKRIHRAMELMGQERQAASMAEVIDCLHELMGDRAALAYMREFEARLQQRRAA